MGPLIAFLILAGYSRADDDSRRGFEAEQMATQTSEERLGELFRNVATNWFELADLLDRLNTIDQLRAALRNQRGLRTIDPEVLPVVSITIPGAFVGQAAQERADVCQNSLARRCVALRQLIDQLGESDLAGGKNEAPVD
jgi:hypothetical protein